jgi:hypothetical protein
MTENRVYAEAYELKAEAGGGFRGVAKNCTTGQIYRGERRETINQARQDAHSAAIELLAGVPYRSGSYRNRRNNWKMNYWFAADAVFGEVATACTCQPSNTKPTNGHYVTCPVVVEREGTGLCPQCLSNSRWNEFAGYPEAAAECREFCRNGHKKSAVA